MMEESFEYDSESSSDEGENTALLFPKNTTENTGYKSILDSNQSNVDRNGNLTSSIFTLVSTMIGGGLLSLPFAFEQGGLGVASLSLLFVLVASTYGGFLIINSKKYCHGKIKNIEDVANVAFGNRGKVAVQILLIVILYLCSVAYFILTVDQLAPIVSLCTKNPSSLWNEKIVLLAIIFLIVFPISLFNNLSALKYTSVLSVVCGLLLCACVVYRSVKNDLGGRINQRINPVKWSPTSLRELLTCISITELTFSCHFNILPIHTELRHQTRQNKRVILCTAMGITYIMNFIVSFFGYMQFRKITDQDITRNYQNDDYVITVGRGSLCILLILSYPLLIVPCRATLNKILWQPDSATPRILLMFSNRFSNGPNKIVWFSETLFLVGTSFLLAYLVPQVNMVWGFVGSLGCTTLIYILPPAFYLRVRHHPVKADLKKISAILLLVTGIFLLIAGAYQSVMNIVSPLPEMIISENVNPSMRNETIQL